MLLPESWQLISKQNPFGGNLMVAVRRFACTFMLATLLAPLFAAAPVAAQSWPTRPVKFILTLGPGSGADISARLLADRLTKKWGQPIVIENRPGGDGVVAINTFATAQDDHVLLFAPEFLLHRPPLPARQSAVQTG
jgi:tripartite-type tricarboxylate transporter receptor subunit TctC